jgi:hypothetical protein
MAKERNYESQARKIVKKVLEDALAVDRKSIGPRNTLCGTMGMESIDELDIAFKIECATGRKTPNLFQCDLPNPPTEYSTGLYKPESMTAIRKGMPHFYNAMSPEDKAAFDRERKPIQFRNAWNVDGLVALVAYVTTLLQQ